MSQVLHITPEQLSAVGGFIARGWGSAGYVIEAIDDTSTAYAAVFRVRAGDGSRFAVVADRWGNCRDVQPGGDVSRMVEAMHAAAVAP